MKSIREQFGETLAEVAEKNKKVLALTCDLQSACKLNKFVRKFPRRFFEVGIAEANGIGIAAGLAMAGYRPFIASFASFITGKNIEIRISISYNMAPVVIVGTHGGLIGPDGATQSALQDISVMRSVPNFKIFQPCSDIETKQIVEYAAKDNSPTYIRISRNVVPKFLSSNYKFYPGKNNFIRKGSKFAIVSSGPMVYNCFKALEHFENKSLFSLVNLSSIRPLNEKFIYNLAKNHKAIITVEDHTTEGGLGSIVSENLSHLKTKIPIFMLGLKNKYIESDSPTNLEEHYQLNSSGIAKYIKKKIKK